MGEITKKEFSKKLAKYGALSLAIAGVADLTGQVVYTDIDPDFVGGLGDSIGIDFNNDGTDDVTILQSNNGNYELVQANSPAGNGVVANSNGYLYASNLTYSSPIDNTLTFYGGGASFCAGPGYDGSAFCGEGEGYLGARFDIDGDLHFGWVRVDITDSSNFKVLDFAYEATPFTTIAAGVIPPLAIDDFEAFNFNYFVDANSQLVLRANTSLEKLQIFNLLGQEVISQKLSSNNENINLASLEPGIYVAQVNIEGKTKSFKIVKN